MGTNTIIGVIPIDRVRAAAERARPHVLRSPLIPVEGAQLKLECLQPTGSFKVRGFFSAALALPPDRLRRGLITVSAGNAAQACAYVARQLGVPCRVVMYDTAPPPKSDGVRRLGGTVIGMPRDELIEWMTTDQWRHEREVAAGGRLRPARRRRAAIPEIAATAKVVAEGAGALAYAALEQLQPGPRTVAVVSGGNVGPTLLAPLLS